MASAEDRRAAERFAVNAGTSCTFVSPVVEDFGPAKVRNVAMDGIGLLLGKRVEPGTVLAVALSNPSRGIAKTVLVRVTHAVAEHGG
ncbi:MAG TPA: hypothetical protein VKE74_10525, partial [Gemmataceae bacterium]|nr:hypothetical protein [Gemmataceae bacterium]